MEQIITNEFSLMSTFCSSIPKPLCLATGETSEIRKATKNVNVNTELNKPALYSEKHITKVA